MASLSTGKCQKATRKAIADILLNYTPLRGQFHEVDALVKILGWKCGIVGIDNDTILRAFTCSDDAYSIELKDMGIGHDGDDVLYVYKNHRIADGTRITAIGVFESVEAALVIDIADPKQRDGLLQNTLFQLDDALERQLKTELARAAKDKARKKKGADEKRSPPSPSSSAKEGQPPQKRTRIPTPDTTSEQTDMHDVAATATIAIGGKSRILTIAVGSPLYKMLLEQCNPDSEEEAANDDDDCASETAGEVRSENKRGRRSARLIIFSILFHPYNRASVDEKQKQRATIADKKKVKRVKGAERHAGLLPHLYDQIVYAQELKGSSPGRTLQRNSSTTGRATRRRERKLSKRRRMRW